MAVIPNTIFGRSESGKSWFTLACALSVIADGGHVLVVDCEDSKAGLIHRLRSLGVPTELGRRIAYRRPLSMGSADKAEIERLARGRKLIIVDSFDVLVSMLGLKEGSLDTRIAGALLQRWAVHSGAAVLLVDHSTEKVDKGVQSDTALGSSAKKQFVDGAIYRADRRGIWRKVAKNQTMVMVGKDRHGGTKPYAEFRDEPAEWGRMVLLTLEPAWPERSGSVITLAVPPGYEQQPDEGGRDLGAIQRLMLDYLLSRGEKWSSRTDVLKAGGDKNNRHGQGEALNGLVEDRSAEVREVSIPGGRVTLQYRIAQPD
jgi:hypothetical protein